MTNHIEDLVAAKQATPENKVTLKDIASCIDGVLRRWQPSTAEELRKDVRSLLKSTTIKFAIKPKYYSGFLQGYRVILTDNTGRRAQCNERGHHYCIHN